MEQRKNIFYEIISTFGYVGYCPVASGTAATAAGLVLIYFCHTSSMFYVILILAFLVLGIIASDYLEKRSGQKDPGIVVIDEVVGIMIAMIGIPFTWKTALCGFFLFRALDMFKIYPINKFENLPGGMGIMMDDVMAGLYTNLILIIAVHWAGMV